MHSLFIIEYIIYYIYIVLYENRKDSNKWNSYAMFNDNGNNNNYNRITTII